MNRGCGVHLAQLTTWARKVQFKNNGVVPHYLIKDVENGELGYRDLIYQPGDKDKEGEDMYYKEEPYFLHLRTMVKVVGVRSNLVQEKPAIQQSGIEPRFT